MKPIAFSIIALAFASCSRSQYHAHVNRAYPDAEIRAVGDNDDEFVIKKPDGSVWYVKAYITCQKNDEYELFKKP